MPINPCGSAGISLSSSSTLHSLFRMAVDRDGLITRGRHRKNITSIPSVRMTAANGTYTPPTIPSSVSRLEGGANFAVDAPLHGEHAGTTNICWHSVIVIVECADRPQHGMFLVLSYRGFSVSGQYLGTCTVVQAKNKHHPPLTRPTMLTILTPSEQARTCTSPTRFIRPVPCIGYSDERFP